MKRRYIKEAFDFNKVKLSDKKTSMINSIKAKTQYMEIIKGLIRLGVREENIDEVEKIQEIPIEIGKGKSQYHKSYRLYRVCIFKEKEKDGKKEYVSGLWDFTINNVNIRDGLVQPLVLRGPQDKRGYTWRCFSPSYGVDSTPKNIEMNALLTHLHKTEFMDNKLFYND